MAPTKRDGRWYGRDAEGLRVEMERYAGLNGHPIDKSWRPVCPCRKPKKGDFVKPGLFALEYDDEQGAAWLVCEHCDQRRPIADSDEYAAVSNAGCYCPEDEEMGEVLVGASVIPATEDLRWVYVAWRAPVCGLVGVYVDWKVDGSSTWANLQERWEATPGR